MVAAGASIHGLNGQDASQPPGRLSVIPLGGLGQVGMNCLVLEQDDGLLVVDCGVTFPEDDHGVDLLYPSLKYLLERAHRVAGVFLTHGHEDHIGALPYLLSGLSVPVWGPAHALKLARRRVRERLPEGQALTLDFRTAVPGQTYRVGPFAVEPIRVSHSIIEATALKIETCAGTVVHTGDFKFDPDPPDGQPTDEARLEALGDAGVDLLLSDSTNIDNRRSAGSERAVGSALEELILPSRQRVVVGLFSSNVQRLISLGQIAKKSGRRIGLLGRSLRTHVETGIDLGHLPWNSEHRVTPDEAARCDPSELLLLAGGTQGEVGSALDRLAQGTHPALSLSAGDRVILSSRVIPGNDRPVSRLMSNLLRLDVHLHAQHTDPDIHTSGHANRAELEHMIELLRPRCFIPVHGTRHHLHNHAVLARDCGVSECLVIENGQVANLEQGRLSRAGECPASIVQIDRGRQPLSATVLSERVALGRSGVALLHIVVDANGSLAVPAQLALWGVVGVGSAIDVDALERDAEHVLRQRGQLWRRRKLDPAAELARFIGWKLERLIGQRPQVRVSLSHLARSEAPILLAAHDSDAK